MRIVTINDTVSILFTYTLLIVSYCYLHGILSSDNYHRNPNFVISTRLRMCHARGVSYRKRKIVARVGDGTPIVVADKRRLQHPFVSVSLSLPLNLLREE